MGLVDSDEEEERYVRERSTWLERKYDFRESKAEVVAWSELGYSSSGIAKRSGLVESTVRSILDQVAKDYGQSAVYGKTEDERAVDRPLDT